jgi:hypothetical protein
MNEQIHQHASGVFSGGFGITTMVQAFPPIFKPVIAALNVIP